MQKPNVGQIRLMSITREIVDLYLPLRLLILMSATFFGFVDDNVSLSAVGPPLCSPLDALFLQDHHEVEMCGFELTVLTTIGGIVIKCTIGNHPPLGEMFHPTKYPSLPPYGGWKM